MNAPITTRELLIHAIACGVLVACAFPGTALRGEVMGPGYRLLDFLPWSEYAEADYPHTKAENTWEFFGQFNGWSAVIQQSLGDGDWPIWNSLEHGGVPLAANCQSAAFYPFRLLHAFLDLHLANTIYVLLKVWLCGFNGYLLVRVMGLSVVDFTRVRHRVDAVHVQHDLDALGLDGRRGVVTNCHAGRGVVAPRREPSRILRAGVRRHPDPSRRPS